jgi:hypothetical protein
MRHLTGKVAQDGDLRGGIADEAIPRTEPLHGELEHASIGSGSAEGFPLEQLACVLEMPRGMLVVTSHQCH